jgi:hypothetical protein
VAEIRDYKAQRVQALYAIQISRQLPCRGIGEPVDALCLISLCTLSQWRTQDFFFQEGSTNSVEDRGQKERGSGGGSPLVRGSGGSCNLVQEISFHIVKFSSFLVLYTIYDDNQFICHC